MDNEKAFKYETFLIIADYSFDVYEETMYENYFSWANYIKQALLNGSYKLVSNTIEKLGKRSNKFFDLPQDEMIGYVMEFFIYSHYEKMHEIIRLIKKVYGHYVSKKIN